MGYYEGKIWYLRRDRFERRFLAVFLVILGIVGAAFELLIRLNPISLAFRMLEDRGWDLELEAEKLFEDAGDSLAEARNDSLKIRELKQEMVKQGKKDITNIINRREEYLGVAEHCKRILAKCNNLSTRKQKAFLIRLDKVLRVYINKCSELITNNQDMTSLNELTIKKLSVIEEAIDKVLNIKEQPLEEVKEPEEKEEQTLTKKISK